MIGFLIHHNLRHSDDVGRGTELGGQLFGVPEWHGLGYPFRSQDICFAI